MCFLIWQIYAQHGAFGCSSDFILLASPFHHTEPPAHKQYSFIHLVLHNPVQVGKEILTTKSWIAARAGQLQNLPPVSNTENLSGKIAVSYICQSGVNEFWEYPSIRWTQKTSSFLVLLCREIKICSAITDKKREEGCCFWIVVWKLELRDCLCHKAVSESMELFGLTVNSSLHTSHIKRKRFRVTTNDLSKSSHRSSTQHKWMMPSRSLCSVITEHVLKNNIWH